MSRWFRHYAGMCRDEKLVRVALRSKQTIERVVWIYSAILESASEIDNGGQFEVDVPEIAYFLRADESDVQGVIDALEAMGRLAEGAVAKWGDRQFQSDRSAERQRLYREKKRAGNCEVLPEPGSEVGTQTVTPPSCDARVTSLSRHGDAPETDTETDTETEEEKKDFCAPLALLPEARERKPSLKKEFEAFYGDYPRKKARNDAEKAFGVVRRTTEFETIMDGVKRLRASATDPQFIPYPASWLRAGQWADDYGTPSVAEPVIDAPKFESTEDWFASLRARRSAAGAN